MDSVDSEDLDFEQDGPETDSNLERIPRLINVLLREAVNRGATAVHLEPHKKEIRVRYRVDGVLHTVMNFPFTLYDEVVNHIKLMSRLDVAEKRFPQDGRILVTLRSGKEDTQVDFRVSALPTVGGETIVLRLLDKGKLILDMTRLGFEPDSLAKFERALLSPSGLILVTGPARSGRSNTLYSAIARLNSDDTCITTAENPVQFTLVGVNQVQVKEGLSFASALRYLLRQDPDIILVGEIPDLETAELVIAAVRTGKLILSTLYADDAPSAVSILVNMGIEPFLVASCLRLVCAQRLIRRTCKDCIIPDSIPSQILIDVGIGTQELSDARFCKGKGCSSCGGTGYAGLVGLFEVLEITPEMGSLIAARCSVAELRQKALEQGMRTIRQGGLVKALSGITSLEEVLAETNV